MLLQFTQAFVQVLALADSPTVDCGLKMEALKVSSLIIVSFHCSPYHCKMLKEEFECWKEDSKSGFWSCFSGIKLKLIIVSINTCMQCRVFLIFTNTMYNHHTSNVNLAVEIMWEHL